MYVCVYVYTYRENLFPIIIHPWQELQKPMVTNKDAKTSPSSFTAPPIENLEFNRTLLSY